MHHQTVNSIMIPWFPIVLGSYFEDVYYVFVGPYFYFYTMMTTILAFAFII